MAQQKLPNVPSPRTTIYDTLLGVDFRADQTEVERRRSPMMVNMISDVGGNPIKRDGFRRVGNAYASIVTVNSETYGLRSLANGHIIIVPFTISSGRGIIVEDSTRQIEVNAACGNIVSATGYQKYVYIFCGNGAIRANTEDNSYKITGIGAGMMSTGNIGSSSPRWAEIVPQSIIGMSPDGTGTQATVLYGKSVTSIYQRFEYAGNGSAKEFKIPRYSKMGAWAKVEVMNANGQWVTKTAGTDYSLGTASSVTAATLDGSGTASFSVVDAKVTFTTAPSSPPQAGEDNVRITVAPFSMDSITLNGSSVTKGYYNETLVKILKTEAHEFYRSRLFLGADEKAYYSELNNALMIPDNNYFSVDSNIVAFQQVGNNLACITGDTGENTIFLASPVTDAEVLGSTMTATYSVRPTSASVGAISSKVGGVLNDEPILLSSTGIYGLLTNWTSERYAVNRSGRVNRKLCKENNLSSAVGVSFNGYYYLAINEKMYIMDSRHKDNTRTGETSYECYYYEGVPDIKGMFVSGNTMYFADSENTYTWNTDLHENIRYYDRLVLDDDGQFVSGTPVQAYWSSVFDDDGMPQILKTLKKKGTMVILQAFTHTGCYVILKKNGDEMQYLGYKPSDLLDFAEINFEPEEFSFLGNIVAVDRFTKKKIKKYKRLQIVVGNDRAEPFALTKIVKTYDIGNYAKR